MLDFTKETLINDIFKILPKRCYNLKGCTSLPKLLSLVAEEVFLNSFKPEHVIPIVHCRLALIQLNVEGFVIFSED